MYPPRCAETLVGGRDRLGDGRCDGMLILHAGRASQPSARATYQSQCGAPGLPVSAGRGRQRHRRRGGGPPRRRPQADRRLRLRDGLFAVSGAACVLCGDDVAAGWVGLSASAARMSRSPSEDRTSARAHAPTLQGAEAGARKSRSRCGGRSLAESRSACRRATGPGVVGLTSRNYRG